METVGVSCLEMVVRAGRMGAVATARLEATRSPLENIVILIL